MRQIDFVWLPLHLPRIMHFTKPSSYEADHELGHSYILKYGICKAPSLDGQVQDLTVILDLETPVE